MVLDESYAEAKTIRSLGDMPLIPQEVVAAAIHDVVNEVRQQPPDR